MSGTTKYSKGGSRRYTASMATLAHIDHDRQLVEKALSSIALPVGVGKPTIDFGPDHSGDASVRLTFPVSRKVALTKARVKQLTALSLSLQQFLYARDIERIPYIRFSETR